MYGKLSSFFIIEIVAVRLNSGISRDVVVQILPFFVCLSEYAQGRHACDALSSLHSNMGRNGGRLSSGSG